MKVSSTTGSTLQKRSKKEEEVLMPLLRQHLTPEEFGKLIEETHKVGHEVKPSEQTVSRKWEERTPHLLISAGRPLSYC